MKPSNFYSYLKMDHFPAKVMAKMIVPGGGEEADEVSNCVVEIEKLTDDCLSLIFQYLPIIDRIRIQQVCKKWMDISQSSWYSFKTLNFCAGTWGYPAKKNVIIDAKIVEKFVELHGRNLRTLDFNCEDGDRLMPGLVPNSNYKISLSDTHFVQVVGNPPQNNFFKVKHTLYPRKVLSILKLLQSKNSISKIEELHLCCMNSGCSMSCKMNLRCRLCADSWRGIFQWLKTHGERIVKFTIDFDEYYPSVENDLALVLATMRKLKCFQIISEGSELLLSDNIWSRLAFESIEEISIHNMIAVRDFRTIKSVIDKTSKLRSFECRFHQCADPHLLFKALAVSSKTLRSITFDAILTSVIERNSLLSTVSALKSIQKIHFTVSALIDDDLLKVVAKNCVQLTHFNIEGCSQVCDIGISYLRNLPNLRVLNIRELIRVHRPCLYNMSALEELYCSDCKNLVPNSLRELLVRGSQRLRCLQMDSKIWRNEKCYILKLGIRVVEKRQSTVPIKFIIEKTEIDIVKAMKFCDPNKFHTSIVSRCIVVNSRNRLI